MRATSVVFPPHPREPGAAPETVRVEVEPTTAGGRRYRLTTTARQRADGPQARALEEAATDLRARTDNPLFDALLAVAVDDARIDSVSELRDSAYRYGAPIACDCFQAGETWTYVWTRDVAYAIDLGLAVFDPPRAVTTLAFKVSDFRPGLTRPAELPENSLQIVQDTGSGGSWPVSTDRVAWALGAEALLASLDGPARADFADLAYRALRGTLEADRLAAYDGADGLYRGELSFLDWRDQTYAPWIVDDLAKLASSKALSTNVCHYRALRLAATLACERGETAIADRYSSWAGALKAAINDRLWLEDAGLYAAITAPESPGEPLGKFDMLGEALAIVSGIADPRQARSILARYPHSRFGPPVYYPHQPDVRVYHNRALWPFVTAYELMAAAAVKAVAAADHAFDSLLRASALSLNNAENHEWLTGRTAFDDGPVISSVRQLWSIGGYLGMVTHVLFGYRPRPGGLDIAPFLTAHMRAVLGGDTATLAGLVHHGRPLTIRLRLPPVATEPGHYPLRAVRLNGRPVEAAVSDADLGADNVLELTFGALVADSDGLTIVGDDVPLTSHDDAAVFSPREPVITDLVVSDGRVRLNFAGQPPLSGRQAPLTFSVLRDGRLAASGIDGDVWFDPEPLVAGLARSYRVIATFSASGNASQPSLAAVLDEGAVAWFGQGGGADPIAISVRAAGRYALGLIYANHHFHIQTGVTNCVKRLVLRRADGSVVAKGVVSMPHLTPVTPTRRSTELVCDLAAGHYQLAVDDFFNMSYLAANASYISPGGLTGPLNTADIRAAELRRIG